MDGKTLVSRTSLAVFMLGMCVFGFLAADKLPAMIQARAADTSDLEPGMDYLKSQSIADLSQVRQTLRQMRIDAISEKALEDQDALFAAFNGSMILGDSRASGFYYYGFLPKSICLAEMNQTMNSLSDYVNQVAAAKPEYLYISFGANDVKARLGTGEEDGYGRLTEEKVNELLAVSPDSKPVICGIIPVAAGVFSEEENNLLNDYNRQLQELCEKNGWIYVQDEALVQNDDSAFGPDGIHFDIPFYPRWAANMLTSAMLEGENFS